MTSSAPKPHQKWHLRVKLAIKQLVAAISCGPQATSGISGINTPHEGDWLWVLIYAPHNRILLPKLPFSGLGTFSQAET
jgi:hypothetical protein